MLYEGKYELINEEVICNNGCFQRTRYWLKGHVRGLGRTGTVVRFIKGYTGDETEVTVDRIIPLNTFMVREMTYYAKAG